MERGVAQQLIKETLQNPFDKDRFIYFVKNLLNHIDESKAFHARGYVKEKFKQAVPVVKTYERVGTYTDAEGAKIDVLIVYLVKNNSLDRARTTLRNFAADYLKQRDEKDAGLVAFVSPDYNDWRFSLVKMEYKITETPSGKVKAKEEFTPARRYSFLVGEHETSHTAQSRLVPIIEDDINDPTLQQLEDAFNIEKVTKEFFEKYRDLFVRVKESLDDLLTKDKIIKDDFAGKGINTVDFAKKLLGQIVFLYFLQKKGWFGVSRGKDWGEGDKKFLRNLFIRAEKGGGNYFNKFLEPLFYEALRLERPKDYYDQFNCRIPFLNGGLFDPISDYDWQDTDIEIPNDIFSNNHRTKEGDTGDGILDIFDRYNFTAKEDEPLEKEVAIDPEMLGKVFENLLEVKDRKSKGTYYTPREIVHYMCQESLTNYLATELRDKVSKKDIETLIKYGETVVEHEAEVESRGKETKTYSHKLPKSIRDNAKLIDEKLETIRICDPAVGSGAFPVGMMSEVIRTRNALTSYMGKDGERTLYNFKRHAIQNCLYGVDIDPGAVEIAKLRLWLSLIVDEEDIKQIKPLPNLDYKIMQGNSLIEILTPELLAGTNDQGKNELIKQVKKAKDELFGISSSPLKDEKRKEIESLLASIIEHDRRVATRNLKIQIVSIKSQGKLFTDKRIEDAERKQILELEQKIQEIENLKLPGPTEHFEWHLNFSEVFHEKKGFDVVIANPPYVRQEKFTQIKGALKKQYKEFFDGRADLYTFFIKLGFNLTEENGVFSYITSNKFFVRGYGKNTRSLFTKGVSLKKVVNFGELPVFQASVDSVILIARNTKPKEEESLDFAQAKSDADIRNIPQFFEANKGTIKLITLGEGVWSLQDSEKLAVLNKIKNHRNTLGLYYNGNIFAGIKSGLDSAFIITKKTKDVLVKQDTKSKKLLKPWFRGKDIKRWQADFKDLYVIYIPLNSVDIDDYPAIKNHLAQFKLKLEKRATKQKWFEMQQPQERFTELFDSPKIVYAEIAKEMRACLDTNKSYGTMKMFFIPHDSVILGILNSKLFDWYARMTFATLGDPWKGGRISFNTMYMSGVPIPDIKNNISILIKERVDKILAITKSGDYLQNSAKQVKVREYEKQIDQLVYKLYGLTPEEIKIVEQQEQ